MSRRALLSVTDKRGVVDFARGIVDLGFEILSTGGTAHAIRDAGIPVTDVSDVTGFPECLDGRLKTLHPLIHGGLLADLSLPAHVEQARRLGIFPIELLCVNLYAFESTVAGPHSREQAVEAIDIGGPAMIRAAAKNSAHVTVVVDPDDYGLVLDSLRRGEVAKLRPGLMAKAFRHTAYYDSVIARYFGSLAGGETTPETLTWGLRRRLSLRYGENPHQQAALYEDPLADVGIARCEQLWGKELSYNNLLDADAAWELVADLPKHACAIIKHGNPCGAACCEDMADSYRTAFAADPVSAFGGIAAFHGVVGLSAAEAMTEKGNFLEVVVAEGYEPAALEVFKHRSGWGQNVRLLRAAPPPAHRGLQVRSIRGGALVQQTDEEPPSEWRVATERTPSESEMGALRFLWTVVRHVKSNAIVVGTSTRLLGVGTGQMNRVQSVRLALEQAGEGAKGAGLASDAFFPFPDSIDTAAKAGITAVVQPGGSKKDADVVARANELGVAMVFTGVRHFRH